MNVKLGISLITMDHVNFERDIKLVEETKKVSYIHVDAMDGAFVPRYGIYPEIVHNVSQITDLPLDLHLMVKDVEFAIDEFTRLAQFETISFHHYQNEGRVFRIIDKILAKGSKPVLTIDLSTSVAQVKEILDHNQLDGVMFMGIHPGVLFQNHRPEFVFKKALEIREYCNKNNLMAQNNLQIDGGFNFETAEALLYHGINNFVGGSSTILAGLKTVSEPKLRSEKIQDNIRRLENFFNA